MEIFPHPSTELCCPSPSFVALGNPLSHEDLSNSGLTQKLAECEAAREKLEDQRAQKNTWKKRDGHGGAYCI